MQQPLPQLGGLFIHCPQNHGRCVHISVSPHGNPQKTKVVFLIYDPTVQALAVTEMEDLCGITKDLDQPTTEHSPFLSTSSPLVCMAFCSSTKRSD